MVVKLDYVLNEKKECLELGFLEIVFVSFIVFCFFVIYVDGLGFEFLCSVDL